MIEATRNPIICAFFFALCIISIVEGKFPKNQPRCAAGDSECLKTVINHYIREGLHGIPAIHLIQLDPLFVPEIKIYQGSNSPVNIKLKFKNAKFNGFSTLDVTRVVGFTKDPNKSSYEVYCRIPKLSIVGDYKIAGKILVLPVNDEGYANLTFDNLDVTAKFHPRVELKNGKEYLQFDNVDVDFTTTRLYIHVDNLFKGDKLLGPTTNNFLNENWSDILKELKQVFRDTIGGIINNVVGAVFGAFPYVDFFLD